MTSSLRLCWPSTRYRLNRKELWAGQTMNEWRNGYVERRKEQRNEMERTVRRSRGNEKKKPRKKELGSQQTSLSLIVLVSLRVDVPRNTISSTTTLSQPDHQHTVSAKDLGKVVYARVISVKAASRIFAIQYQLSPVLRQQLVLLSYCNCVSDCAMEIYLLCSFIEPQT